MLDRASPTEHLVWKNLHIFYPPHLGGNEVIRFWWSCILALGIFLLRCEWFVTPVWDVLCCRISRYFRDAMESAKNSDARKSDDFLGFIEVPVKVRRLSLRTSSGFCGNSLFIFTMQRAKQQITFLTQEKSRDNNVSRACNHGILGQLSKKFGCKGAAITIRRCTSLIVLCGTP